MLTLFTLKLAFVGKQNSSKQNSNCVPGSKSIAIRCETAEKLAKKKKKKKKEILIEECGPKNNIHCLMASKQCSVRPKTICKKILGLEYVVPSLPFVFDSPYKF